MSSLLLSACGGKGPSSSSEDSAGLIDADGDGHFADVDCDDSNPAIHPEALESCDGLDNDCDGYTDEGDATDALGWYRDSDGDGYGDPSAGTAGCQAPPGYVADATDCNDTTSAVNPDADEVCNDGLDNDCDGDESACYLQGTVALEDATSVMTASDSGVRLGSALSGLGDVDGDGLGDVLLGAPYDNKRGTTAGAAYLMTGPLSGALDVDTAHAALLGTSAGHAAGSALSPAGDIDGDGYADLFVGALSANGGGSGSGEAYLILGPVSGQLLLADSDAKLVGELADDAAGSSIAGLGDVNGDGLGDLLVGAPGQGDGGFQSRGAAYLVHGVPSGTLDLSDAAARITSEQAYDRLGSAVASAGDQNGDGLQDLLIGAPDWPAGDAQGAVFVLYGPQTGSLGTADADLMLVGGALDQAGSSLSAGDIDGDGHPELLVGAPGYSDHGAAYLVAGPAPSSQELSAAAAMVLGADSGDLAGCAVAADGDLNADGFGDILVGAAGLDDATGGAGVFYGPVAGTFEIDDANVRLEGSTPGDLAGSSAAWAGDINGDTRSDILIGAPGRDGTGVDIGTAYLVLGEGG